MRRESAAQNALGGAIVLAGGRSVRLGGVHKPAISLAGQSLLGHLLARLDGLATVVVGVADGIPDELRSHVVMTREQPPSGGPVAALAEGVRHLDSEIELVALAAADMPFLTRGHFERLAGSIDAHDAAVPVARGRPQWLASLWRLGALRHALADLGEPAGRAVRSLFSRVDVRFVEVTRPEELRELFDVDTPDDLDEARRMTNDGR